MATRLLHVSDLHVGAHEDLEVAAALARFVEQAEPQLVIASGDLSHRGRRSQLEEAAAFLRVLSAEHPDARGFWPAQTTALAFLMERMRCTSPCLPLG